MANTGCCLCGDIKEDSAIANVVTSSRYQMYAALTLVLVGVYALKG